MGVLSPFGRLLTLAGPRRRFAAAARRQHRLMEKALASVVEALVATDALGRVTLLNAIAEGLTGWSLALAAGRPLEKVLRLVADETLEPVASPVALVVAQGRPISQPVLCTLLGRDGRPIPVEYRAAPLHGDDGEVVGVVLLVRDATERRQIQAAMASLAAIVEYSDDAIVGSSLDGRILSWNAGAERLYGHAAVEIVGRPLALLQPDDSTDDLAAILAQIGRGERVKPYEAVRVRRDGQRIDVSITMSPLKEAGGRIIGVSSIGRDISERKRAEEEARRTELLRRLAAAQEEERRRIARELHDQMGQHLAALGLGLEALKDNPHDHARLGRLQELAAELGREVHNLALELRPTALDDLGLVAALQNYLERWSERSGIDVDFHGSNLDSRRLPPQVETNLYRIVQEALTNVLRHAAATSVSLVIERKPDHLLAIVEDNGCGFDAAAAQAASDIGARLGLLGMSERAAAVGGTLQVESAPESGTTLYLRVPLSSEGDPPRA
jgi:PAS domain S-box-containing protein